LRDPKGAATFKPAAQPSASNAWFPQVLSVISIPDEMKSCAAQWRRYGKTTCSTSRQSTICRRTKTGEGSGRAGGLFQRSRLAEIERHRGALPAAHKDHQAGEIETLLASPDEIGQDKIEGDSMHAAGGTAPPLEAI